MVIYKKIKRKKLHFCFGCDSFTSKYLSLTGQLKGEQSLADRRNNSQRTQSSSAADFPNVSKVQRRHCARKLRYKLGGWEDNSNEHFLHFLSSSDLPGTLPVFLFYIRHYLPCVVIPT